MSSGEVCFTSNMFNAYLFILIILVVFIMYIQVKKTEELSNVELNTYLSKKELVDKIKNLQDKLYNSEKNEQTCQSNLYETRQFLKHQIYNQQVKQTKNK